MAEQQSLSPLSGSLFGPGWSAAEEQAVQQKLWQLLARQTAHYTAGDSSSVPVELAQELLTSLCFTLRLGSAETLSGAQWAAADFDALLLAGQARIQRKLKVCYKRYRAACLTAPALENRSLTDTLRSIGSFFRRYDALFFAHQCPCDIDYQLWSPIPETLAGVEYLNEYLRRLLLEHQLLRHFDQTLMRRLLERHCPDWRILLINLCDPIATNALGLVLLGKNPLTLTIPPEDLADLEALFASRPAADATALLEEAAGLVCGILEIRSVPARRYLQAGAVGLSPRITAALPKTGLSNIFLSFSSFVPPSQI